MVIYKAMTSDSYQSGDAFWISHKGKIAIIIDAVTLSETPEETKEALLYYLDHEEERFLPFSLEEILKNLNHFLFHKGEGNMMAVIAIVRYHTEHFEAAWLGNIGLNQYRLGEKTELIEMIRRPDMVLGQYPEVTVNTSRYPLDTSAHYILYTDGLDLSTVDPDFTHLQSEQLLREWAEACNTEKDWTLVIFPFESTQTHEKQSWPYDPFIGEQEERDHEKRGLAKLADALFSDEDFHGFKIVGGGYIPRQGAIRMMDGILVSPYGIILIELKDHRGNITLSTTNRGDMKVHDPKTDYFKKETSPHAKLNEILTVFSQKDSLKSIIEDVRLRRIGTVLFTHPGANVKVIIEEEEKLLPQRIGNIIISTPAQFPIMLKKYIKDKENFGKRYKKITLENIDKVTELLKGEVPNDNNAKFIIKKRFIFEEQNPIADESTEYYTLYKGEDIRRKKPVWIKKYKLSTMTRNNIEEEAERIGREADALQEFQGCKEIQDYYDSEHIGEYHYIVLEYIEGKTLEQWMLENHTQEEKLALLIQIADIVIEIEEKNVPHRALNNQNFRIADNGEIHLINFELCKIDYLPTLPPNERRAFSTQFEAKEVSTVVNQSITTAADIYSFAIIICYVLSEQVLITAQTHKKFTRNAKNWIQLSQECGIDYALFKDIESAFDTIAKKRPDASAMKHILEKWMNT